MDQTPGKGPFSRRRTCRIESSRDGPRWSAPRIDELTTAHLRDLLKFTKSRADAGIHKLFLNLACMEPRYRLARNLSELARCMASGAVTDVLANGLSELEHQALADLERHGIPIDLLSVAHALLDIRERREAARQLDDLFFRSLRAGGSNIRLDPGDL